jgi:hypothetical protein
MNLGLMQEYSSSIFKKGKAYLTGVGKILMEWKLTAESVKSWACPVGLKDCTIRQIVLGLKMG